MRATASIALLFLLTACNDTPAPAEAPSDKTAAKTPTADAAAKKAAPSCTWTADHSAASVGWTAFKFTEKTGVGGAFDTLTVAGGQGMDAPWKALDGLTFEIDTASVNSKNPERDAKIKQHFFGGMSDTATIKGKVKANSAGKATLSIAMNGATHNVVVDVKHTEGGPLSLSGTIDVETWDGGGAIAALNKVCDELHKGADGVSKLWSEVAISAEVPLKKTCG